MVATLDRWKVGTALLLLLLPFPAPSFPQSTVLLATTTSTRDAGLLDSLLPAFERGTGWRVKVIAVGSGQALEMGRRGDADVVLAHAPDAERVLFDSGYFTTRRRVMYNDFVVAGPRGDRAGVAGMTDAVAALGRIARARAPFVSRGDRSGTHQKELTLWRLAAVAPPAAGAWYAESGQGMGATLQIADHRGAYVLTDRATLLAWRARVALVPLVEGDTLLRNVYHVMEVSARNSRRVQAAGARALADFFVSPEAQRLIGAFGRVRFGRSLFIPDAN
jgi:tungstate transport system substrate-binding protein